MIMAIRIIPKINNFTYQKLLILGPQTPSGYQDQNQAWIQTCVSAICCSTVLPHRTEGSFPKPSFQSAKITAAL